MRVSVVIPTFNRRGSLARCLASLSFQTFPLDDFEVIVVSDGSTDDTISFLQSFSSQFLLRWFSQENSGSAAAQNLGVGKAAGDIIIFLDDDCICEPGVIAAHVEAHAHGGQIVGLGTTLLHPDSLSGTLKRLKHRLAQSDLQHLTSHGATAKDMMLCANSSIPRTAALDTPFDTTYERMHDVEAGQRLLARSFVPQFVPGAVVHELFTKTANGALRDSRLHGKFEVILTERWPAFKPHAGIGIINEGTLLKRSLRKFLATHPSLTEFILGPVFKTSEVLRSIPPFGSIAARTLQARMSIQHLSAAIQQAGSLKAVEDTFGKRVPVLIYHNVGEPKPREYPGLTTPTAEFEKQIRHLSELGYQAIKPFDWLRWRDFGGKLPDRPVMIVFDDAYRGASLTGFPILESYGFAAACMVVTGFIGSTNHWDELAGRPSFPLMSAEQIRNWEGRGIEFGGHTRSHPYLPEIAPEQIEDEMRGCFDDLTALLGKPPASFAYPFGGFSRDSVETAQRHFKMSFTVWPGILHLKTDPQQIPRIAFLPGESRFGMWCRLRLGKNPFEVARNRYRQLLHRRGRQAVTGASA